MLVLDLDPDVYGCKDFRYPPNSTPKGRGKKAAWPGSSELIVPGERKEIDAEKEGSDNETVRG